MRRLTRSRAYLNSKGLQAITTRMHPCVGRLRQLLFLRRLPVRCAGSVCGICRTIEHSPLSFGRSNPWALRMLVQDSPILALKCSDVCSADIKTPDSEFSYVVHLTERRMYIPQFSFMMNYIFQTRTFVQIIGFIIGKGRRDRGWSNQGHGASHCWLMVVPSNWRPSFAPRPRRLAWEA